MESELYVLVLESLHHILALLSFDLDVLGADALRVCKVFLDTLSALLLAESLCATRKKSVSEYRFR